MFDRYWFDGERIMANRFFNRGDLQRQFGRFVQVGILNTVGNYLIYLALNLVMPYVFAYSIAFVIGVLTSAWLNSRYSFATRLTGRNLLRFFVVYLINFALSLQLLIVFVEVIGINDLYAPLVVLAVFTPINFLCSKLALSGRG